MIKKIIIDTSPIIFLSKIGYLNILTEIFKRKITVTKNVINEIYKYQIPSEEDLEIKKFLKVSNIVSTSKKIINSATLSSTDNEVLSYSIENKYNLIITDDNFLRKIAKHEKITSIGTLGILLRCIDKKILKSRTVKKLLNLLIERYDFRISLDVYKNALEYIDKLNR
jgi:predicted nucleic acid-binding protein